MNIKTLTLKNRLVDENTGEEYFDLSAPSFTYDGAAGVRSIYYVTQETEGRPDLISIEFFGSAEYIDAICITNNIFNPFSIKEGDVLVIPNLENEDLHYSKPKQWSRDDRVTSQYNNIDLQSQPDQNRIQRLIKKAQGSKNPAPTPLPPNLLQQGQASKEFTNGKIRLGTNLNNRENN